jgi:hypothetical protein
VSLACLMLAYARLAAGRGLCRLLPVQPVGEGGVAAAGAGGAHGCGQRAAAPSVPARDRPLQRDPRAPARRARRGQCRHPRPADSVKAGCKPARFPTRLLMGSPRPRAGRLGVAGSPRSRESCKGSRMAPQLVTLKQRDPLICYTPRSCCGRYHADEQPGGAEVCPLPTRIVFSYLTLWVQRSRSQRRLPRASLLTWPQPGAVNGQCHGPIYKACRCGMLPDPPLPDPNIRVSRPCCCPPAAASRGRCLATGGERGSDPWALAGAPSADSLLVTQRLVGVAVGAHINHSGVLLGTDPKAR